MAGIIHAPEQLQSCWFSRAKWAALSSPRTQNPAGLSLPTLFLQAALTVSSLKDKVPELLARTMRGLEIGLRHSVESRKPLYEASNHTEGCGCLHLPLLYPSNPQAVARPGKITRERVKHEVPSPLISPKCLWFSDARTILYTREGPGGVEALRLILHCLPA